MSGAQLPLPLRSKPSLTRADFIVAPGNEQAVRFIDAFPAWPAAHAALHGPSGSGKSHLVSVWAERSGAAIVEAGALDDAVLRALVPGAPLAVEDIEVVGSETRDRALFALLNRDSPLLLTAREPPSAWRARLPDLASRFAALLSFALWSPDDALLAALARKLFADRQLRVPDAVIERMIGALERSPSAIRDFVDKADALALAAQRPVTTGLIRELLPARGTDLA